MKQFFMYLEKELGYTSYEIQIIQYTMKALLYETSKFILMGIFFYMTGFFIEYLFAVLSLIILRTSTGGLHFKSYISCFLFTLTFFIISVIYLPTIHIPVLAMFMILFVCMLITHYIGPVTSCYRKTPTGILIKNSKRNASLYIFCYCLLLFIIPSNQYMTIGFWVIILQTIQLMVAFILKARRC